MLGCDKSVMESDHLPHGSVNSQEEENSFLEPKEICSLTDSNVKTHHLSEGSAVFFVIGNVLGAGLVALPYAMKLMSYYGTLMFVISATIMCYCGIALAKSCDVVMATIHDRKFLRDPYPALAEYSLGQKAKYFIVVALNSCLFIAGVVLILLTGEILSKLVPIHFGLSERNELRIWFTICAHVLLPFTYFGTPKDFVFVAILATFTSVGAAVLVIVNLFMSIGNVDRTPGPPITPSSAFVAFGTILFGFGGIAVFPNVQNDLKKPEHFVRSVTVGYFIVSVVNTLIPLGGFVIYGGLIKDDILTTMTELPLYKNSQVFSIFVIIAQVLLCVHILCTYILNINTFHLQIESYLDIPVYFCWQRVAIRTTSMMIVLVLCLSVPNFGPVLSFVGGVFSALLEIILPIVFFWVLQRGLPLYKKSLFGIVIVVALFGASGNAFIGMQDIIKVISGTYKP